MDRVLRSVAGLLLFGDSESIDRVARDLVASHDPSAWELLVGTIRSDEDMPLRIRCLEVLARAASIAGEDAARQILVALGGTDAADR
ncbi:MAG TPA: hypothetical protein VM305_06690 [Candidatus Limnocylindrales bacterium]|jgi:hypothetical protein|nr:hypothetical protein [Candidatus Limnocylindrales bacterium]